MTQPTTKQKRYSYTALSLAAQCMFSFYQKYKPFNQSEVMDNGVRQ